VIRLTCTEGHHYEREASAVRITELNDHPHAVAHCDRCNTTGASRLTYEQVSDLQAAGVGRIQRNALTEKWMTALEQRINARAITEAEIAVWAASLDAVRNPYQSWTEPTDA
jgi:hypothetical protein